MTIAFLRRHAGLLRRAGWAGALALPVLLGAAGSCSAAAFVVQNAAGSGAGSLRDAITLAQADSDASDTITFGPSVTGTIALGGTELAIGKSVSITGPGASALALDAGGTSRILNISAGTVSLSGLTLRNGNATDGGGIFNTGTLTVTACALTGDTAQRYGGGIFNQSGATLSLASDTLSGDTTSSYGGGVYNQGMLTATGCTFSADTADYGGGLFSQTNMTLVNDTFSGDSATTEGGGLYTQGTATVTSCTFAGDSALAGSGDGIVNWGTLTVTASLFSGNVGGDIANGEATTTSGGSNLLGDASPGAFSAAGAGDQFGVTNAMLDALADNGGPTQTCAVFTGSPAIGADSALPTSTDQRGTPRTAAQHTTGAFEYVAPAPLVPVVRTHVLWNNADGRVMLWNLDAQGGITSHTFGPYADPAPQDKWTATALATGPDGESHIVWNNTDGRVALWTVYDSGSFTLAGFGPYTDDSVGPDPSVNKWSATAVSVGPDGVTHLLWGNTDHRMMLWNVDSTFNLLDYAGFGPYGDDAPASDPARLWTATALATGPDNVSRVLWNDADGRVALWNMDSAFGFTQASFGPYTDDSVGPDPSVNKWSATAVSVGPDGVTHLLWGNTDHRMMLWNVDSTFNLLDYAGFGPYGDDAPASDPARLWTATALATGPDNVSRVLWNDADGRVALWDVDAAFGFTLGGYGPFTDSLGDGAPTGSWTATAISAPPGEPLL